MCTKHFESNRQNVLFPREGVTPMKSLVFDNDRLYIEIHILTGEFLLRQWARRVVLGVVMDENMLDTVNLLQVEDCQLARSFQINTL